MSSLVDKADDDDYQEVTTPDVSPFERKQSIKTGLNTYLNKTNKKKYVKDLAAIKSASLDKRHRTEEEDQAKVVPAEDNMKAYMENFSQTFEIPSYYV